MTDEDRALVDRFLDMMAAEAGASPNTLSAYRSDLARAAEDAGGRSAQPRGVLARLGGRCRSWRVDRLGISGPGRFFGFLRYEGLATTTLPPPCHGRGRTALRAFRRT